MSTINIGTSSTTAFKVESDTTGALLIKTGATPTLAMTVSSGQDATFAGSLLSSGNVGAGTTSPSQRLDSVTSNNSATAAQLSLRNTYSANNVSSGIAFGFNTASADPDVLAAIYSVVTDRTTRNGDLRFYTAASATNAERMRLDSSGNLGLGVTPSAWTSFKALQISSVGAIMSHDFGGDNAQMNIGNNVYYDGSYKYLVSSRSATRYDQSAGQHAWYTAASGTAGNAITFSTRMTLDNSGNLGLGVTPTVVSNYTVLHMSGSSGSYLMFSQGSTQRGAVYGNAGGLTYQTESGAPTHTWYQGASPNMTLNSTGDLIVPRIYANTTGSTDYVAVGASGILLRSTSSLRYKEIVSYDVDALADKFMQMRPFIYTSTSDNDDKEKHRIGFGAEHADELGLSELVSYGAEGQCENFAYDRSVALLQNYVKRLEKRLAALEAK